MALQILPPINLGFTGVDVTLRQVYSAGGPGSQSRVMLSSLLRGAIKYPKKELTKSTVQDIQVGNETLASTELEVAVHRTVSVKSREARTRASNENQRFFVSFADETQYNKIDDNLARLIAGGVLELIGTALV